jgi:acetylornithine deacetylase/succinyl-diaminopimelate desuccinylase-like protein
MRFLAALPMLLLLPLCAQQQAHHQLAREIFKQLIEINTTDSIGDNTRAAEAMAARFREAGYAEGDVRILTPAPILFIGHLDVVEAKRSDWSFDPFETRPSKVRCHPKIYPGSGVAPL